MRVVSAESTELFVGPERAALQVVAVTVANDGRHRWSGGSPAVVEVTGNGLTTPEPSLAADVSPGDEVRVEVGVAVPAGLRPGTTVPAQVRATDGSRSARAPLSFVVAEPGWRMFLVSHFHYDPVWWNTQAFYTETWEKLPREQRPWEGRRQQPAFTLLEAHLDMARRDPDYKFVLAELDYLKPYWDAFPGERPYLRRLLAEGRLELMGGTYNEPNTNLTCAESTIRNAVYGIGYQRHVLGGDPATAWQLDVFGHDPQFPGLMADAGLTSSSWARGPFHQWGPRRAPGGNPRMQFDSEFEWVAPSGSGLLTSYMPNHYSAGWDLDAAPTLAAAEDKALELFGELRAVAATRNVLLPVGTDYTPPNRWITDISRDWNSRYTWPKFQVALPREFFDAVRDELAQRGGAVPQTRDMNPVYTGKDVSFIDTKQAQRDAENTLLSAEKFATVAALLGARYPSEACDKSWRQLLFGAHHDGITGTESDQVYLDLLGGWREALELASEVLDDALEHIGRHVDTRGEGLPVTVFNPLSWPRTDVVRADVVLPVPAAGLRLHDEAGGDVGFVVDETQRDEAGKLARAVIAFVARDVPGVGYRTFRVVPAQDLPDDSSWTPAGGCRITNAAYEVGADPRRGGAVDHLLDRRTGKSLLKPGGLANEVRAYDEYPTHPEQGEGPWHLLPLGTVQSQTEAAAEVVAERCAIGQRLLVRTGVGAVCDLTQAIVLYDGVDRVECTTLLDGFSGQDTLFRVRMAADVRGGMPLAEVGDAVIGRGFGFPEVDVERHPHTLDNPACNWFGVGATARVELTDAAASGPRACRAISVAEVVAGDGSTRDAAVRDLVVALVRKGVTATVSRATGSRYGSLDVDSNLPDVRIAIGGPQDNPFTAEVLDGVDDAYRVRLSQMLDDEGTALLWVPAAAPLAAVWQPGADLRRAGDLPVLVVAGRDPDSTRTAVRRLVGDLRDGAVTVVQPASLDGSTDTVEDYTFAVLNRGLPGCNVDVRGDLHLSLMRSCSGWPSGVWLDPPRRTVPDGSSFQLQHWTHEFAYAITAAAGDWREAGIVRAGHEHNNPLRALVPDLHEGPLPAAGSLVRVDGQGMVLAAMKPTGNPMAQMAGCDMDPSAGVTLRCYEAHGAGADIAVELFRPIASGCASDVLERRGEPLRVADGRLHHRVEGYGVATLVVKPADRPAEGSRQLGRRAEPAQPIFSDYWLHNRGAAPLGYQPVTVAIPPRAVATDGAFDLPVQVASERTDAAVAGHLTVAVPPGWEAEPAQRRYRLAPGAHTEVTVRVRPPAAAAAGRYFVAARISDDAGQVHEDVVTVDLGGGYRPAVGDPGNSARTLLLERATRKAVIVDAAEDGLTVALGAELTVDLLTDAVSAGPRHRSELVVQLHNRVAGEIRGEAQVLSPYGTWDAIRPGTQGFAVAGGDRTTLRFAVQPPLGTPAVSAWALVKIGYFGRVLYTRSVPVVLGGPR